MRKLLILLLGILFLSFASAQQLHVLGNATTDAGQNALCFDSSFAYAGYNFTAQASYTLTGLTVYAASVTGTPGTVVASIWFQNASGVNGTQFASPSGGVASITAGANNFTFTNGPSLVAGQTYWILLNCSTLSSSHWFRIGETTGTGNSIWAKGSGPLVLSYNQGTGAGNQVQTINIKVFGDLIQNAAVTVNAPANNSQVLTGQNLTINWTSTGTGSNLVNTTLFIDGVLNQTISISGTSNTTVVNKTFSTGQHNFSVQACIATSCTNSSLFNLTANTWIEGIIYGPSASTFGSLNTFGVTLNTSGQLTVSAANFIYNGTVYSVGSIDNLGNFINITNVNFTIPSVAGNITWRYNFTFNDTTSGTSTARNVTITDVLIDDCSTFTITLYNFTAFDERALTFLNATTNSFNASYNVQLYDSQRSTLVANYSRASVLTNPFRICVKNNLVVGSNYKLDLELQYRANSYAIEYYNLINEEITNADLNTNISLYDLDTNHSQEFRLIYRDSSFLPVPNAVIQIQRRYINEGIFRTVEQPKTDNDGLTIAHLETNNAVYTFIAVVNGQVQGTFSNKIAYCPNPTFTDCEIALNELMSNVANTDYATISGLSFNLDYNDSTRNVRNIFSVLSGVPANITMKVTFNDNFGNNTICQSSIFTSSGTQACNIPIGFGNTSVIANLYYNGNSIGETVISLAQDPTLTYVGSRVLIAVLMILSLVGVSLVGIPIISAFFLIIGLVLLVFLNVVASTGIIGAGATVLWFIIAVVIVIFRGGNR